jgi:predicted  nucleic acid-binding Zn-ribbon protein
MANWFKREAKTVEDDLGDFERQIEAEVKKLGSAAKSIIHHDILDHAADTVASLKAKTVEERAKVEARLSEIKTESVGLLEKHRRCMAVLTVVENGLRDLEAATDAKADVAQAPVDTVVDAALSPAAE